MARAPRAPIRSGQIAIPRAARITPGSATGAGLEGLGQALGSLAERVAKFGEEQTLRAETAFVTEKASTLRQQGTEILNRRRGELAGNPDGFARDTLAEFNALREAALKEAPSDRARVVLEGRLATVGDSLFDSAARIELQVMREFGAVNLDAALGHLETTVFNDPGQFETALQQAREDITAAEHDFLDPGDAATLRQSVEQRLAEAAIRNRIVEDPRAALSALRPAGEGEADDPLVGRLSTDRRLVLAASAEAAINDLESAERQAEAERNADIREVRALNAARLDIAILDRQAGRKDVEQALANGTITPAKAAELIRRVAKRDEDLLEVAQQKERVALAIGGLAPLDPRSGEDRDALDAYYRETLAPRIRELDTNQAFSELALFVDRVGIVPPALRGQLRGTLRSGETEQKVAAADLIDRIRQRNPAALQDFAKEDIAVAEQISVLIGRGVEPQKAVERAEDLVFNADEPARALRRARLTQDNILEVMETRFIDDMNQSVVDRLEVPDPLVAEYREAVSKAYELTGDDEAADRQARTELQAIWSPTRVLGPARWMKLAPERFGLPGLSDSENAAWMREQALEDIRKQVIAEPEGSLSPTLGGLSGPLKPTIQAPAQPEPKESAAEAAPGPLEERLLLQADPITAREAGIPGVTPSYRILLRNAEGALDFLRDGDGRVLRWTPNYKTSPAFAREEKRISEAERRARKEAEAIRSAPVPEVLN